MTLTKKQKEMIRDYLELRFSVDSHPNALQTLIDEKEYISLLEKVNCRSADLMAEIEEWESRQLLNYVSEIRRSGLTVGSTVGKERTKKARDEREETMDRLARMRAKLKTKVLIF